MVLAANDVNNDGMMDILVGNEDGVNQVVMVEGNKKIEKKYNDVHIMS